MARDRTTRPRRRAAHAHEAGPRRGTARIRIGPRFGSGSPVRGRRRMLPAPPMEDTMKLVRTNQEPWTDALNKGRFGNRRKPLAGVKLQSGLWELAPGKRSFPLH